MRRRPSTPTRVIALLIAAGALAAGCGSKAPEPAESPASAPAPPSGANDANRRLSQAECASLGQSIVDACAGRGNDRSAELDGWCNDMVRKNSEGGTWVADDCLPHFRAMDSFCFGSANNAHGMKDCDQTVDRSR
jgi:hypothetical protein